MTDAAHLERSYRRLLLAYPARYRRRHAAEIVTTLLDMAEPDRRRPSAAESGQLLAAGLRQRFRLPARRPLPWIAAVLVTLILGAFGAAAGSWAAAQTFADLPGRATFGALSRLVADGSDRFEQRDTTPHAVASWFSAVDNPGWTAGPARARLAAAGWQVTAVRSLPVGASYSADGRPRPIDGHGFDATRAGLHVRVTGYTTTGHGTISVLMWPESTGWRWPLTVAGALLGLLIGWPLAAATAYRLRSRPLGRARLSAALTGAALAALAVPAFACYANLGLMVRTAGDPDMPTTVHSALTAGPFETYGWRWMMLELAVTGLLLGAAAIAVPARAEPREPAPHPATS